MTSREIQPFSLFLRPPSPTFSFSTPYNNTGGRKERNCFFSAPACNISQASLFYFFLPIIMVKKERRNNSASFLPPHTVAEQLEEAWERD